MRIHIVFCLFFTLSLACNSGKPEQSNGPTASSGDDKKELLEQEIKALETELRSQSATKLDKEKALELILKSERFISSFPKDPVVPDLLFRTADLARGIADYGLAIKHWGTVYNDYPRYEKAPDAHFLIGFTFENYLNDKKQAKQYYQQFLKKYPGHHLASQVEHLLQVIDKSPEELVKEFQKKNEQNK